MIVGILLAFTVLFGLVWKDLQSNEGSAVDRWVSFLALGAALIWLIGIAFVENPIRPLEMFHDMLIKIPAIRPYIDS